MFPKDQLSQEVANKQKKLVEIERKVNRTGLFYKTGDTEKYKVYNFRKYRTMRSLELVISNGTITLENAANDQVYLKNAIHSSKKSARSILPAKIDEKNS